MWFDFILCAFVFIFFIIFTHNISNKYEFIIIVKPKKNKKHKEKFEPHKILRHKTANKNRVKGRDLEKIIKNYKWIAVYFAYIAKEA